MFYYIDCSDRYCSGRCGGIVSRYGVEGGRVMDIATIVMSAYFAVIIFAGFYVLWREWRMRAEEEKRRIREKIDEYMKERER